MKTLKMYVYFKSILYSLNCTLYGVTTLTISYLVFYLASNFFKGSFFNLTNQKYTVKINFVKTD